MIGLTVENAVVKVALLDRTSGLVLVLAYRELSMNPWIVSLVDKHGYALRNPTYVRRAEQAFIAFCTRSWQLGDR